MTAFTEHFSELAPFYEVILSDVWGVTHNGVEPLMGACEALAKFRRRGVVILITNAPRPRESVLRQLARIGVPSDVCDGIVTSGDVTRAVIAERPGQSVFHLGPERNNAIFEGLDVRFASAETADYVICSGLFDDQTEEPEDYRKMLELMRVRDLFMVCGNPDVVVENGDKLLYCAGAIADLYKSLGGTVLYAGKPYRPIYEQALGLALATRGRPADLSRVLAIGDSVRTDVKGAAAFGVDCLFLTAGIHAEELGGRDNPDAAATARLFSAASVAPKAVMKSLLW